MNDSAAGQHDEGEAFGLQRGEMYRVSYAVGTAGQTSRVTRSLAIYDGAVRRRLWDGQDALCFDFQRPQGRPLALLRDQIVEVRPAGLNERGQLVLVDQPGRRRRRLSRRLSTRAAW